MIYLKHKWKGLLASLALALAAGGVGALLSGGMGEFDSAAKPPLTPPGWVFPAVWTLLYLCMGTAAWRIWELRCGDRELRRSSLRLYAAQLAANALWPALFFGLGLYWAAAVWLAALLALVVWTLLAFRRLDDLAVILMAPYALWCAFALYLNIGVAALN